MYLFKPKAPPEAAATPGGDETGVSPFERALRPAGARSLTTGSAAEWALGELLIRLGNRGRGLRREPPPAEPE